MSWESLKLTDHFALGEFACKGVDCCCHGAVLVDDRLPLLLEEIRAVTGAPIFITSGFRCDAYNARVGGHPASFHRVGMAADMTSFILRDNLEDWAIKIGQIAEARLGERASNVIFYPKRRFIHVDCGHRIAELVRGKD